MKAPTLTEFIERLGAYLMDEDPEGATLLTELKRVEKQLEELRTYLKYLEEKRNAKIDPHRVFSDRPSGM
jgi:hypothetical protein